MDIELLQKICRQLPAVTEDIKWGNDLCFLVGAKLFCVASLEGEFRVSFKVPDEHFEELCARDGFIPAPYMARAKWVSVIEPSKVSPKEWDRFIQKSYELVKARLTKKVKQSLGIDN
jgi:predicted DNA-binding protein (MmcQ/YjbR family)